jgi:hypothetical protein
MSTCPDLDLSTVDITVRIGRVNLNRLTAPGTVRCKAAWLTLQPDGTYALGLLAHNPHPRLVRNNDAAERLSLQ